MSTNTDLITELRSAAETLRTPTGCIVPAQDKIAAELLERAADALAVPQNGPEVHSFDPTAARATVTLRWPDGVCLGYDLSRDRYTDNQPPVAAAIRVGGSPLSPEQAAGVLDQIEREGMA